MTTSIPVKKLIPPVLLLCGVTAACNSNRLPGDEGDDDEDMAMSGVYDLAGLDLSKKRDRDAACASVKAEATLQKKPVDIIFVIDNSGSMTDEIQAVQQNINKNVADIIGKSGLDYRVIMLARHGNYNGALTNAICVEKPLSTLATCRPVPTRPGPNPPKFYHYSRQIESSDSFDRILGTYNGSEGDEFGLGPGGWSKWLRTDAFKVFVEITDDNSTMNETTFETRLFALLPKHFGDATNRNYVFHSITGLKENTPPTKAWGPMDPVQTAKCTRGGGAVNPGAIYQNLSRKTGGLRFPICEHASFDAVFSSIATGVIAGSKVACDFPMPMPPPGQKVDLDSVLVEYTPNSMGAPQTIKQVPNAAACAPSAFYIEKDRVNLCPATCTTVQADANAKVEVVFDCLSIIG